MPLCEQTRRPPINFGLAHAACWSMRLPDEITPSRHQKQSVLMTACSGRFRARIQRGPRHTHEPDESAERNASVFLRPTCLARLRSGRPNTGRGCFEAPVREFSVPGAKNFVPSTQAGHFTSTGRRGGQESRGQTPRKSPISLQCSRPANRSAHFKAKI